MLNTFLQNNSNMLCFNKNQNEKTVYNKLIIYLIDIIQIKFYESTKYEFNINNNLILKNFYIFFGTRQIEDKKFLKNFLYLYFFKKKFDKKINLKKHHNILSYQQWKNIKLSYKKQTKIKKLFMSTKKKTKNTHFKNKLKIRSLRNIQNNFSIYTKLRFINPMILDKQKKKWFKNTQNSKEYQKPKHNKITLYFYKLIFFLFKQNLTVQSKKLLNKRLNLLTNTNYKFFIKINKISNNNSHKDNKILFQNTNTTSLIYKNIYKDVKYYLSYNSTQKIITQYSDSFIKTLNKVSHKQHKQVLFNTLFFNNTTQITNTTIIPNIFINNVTSFKTANFRFTKFNKTFLQNLLINHNHCNNIKTISSELAIECSRKSTHKENSYTNFLPIFFLMNNFTQTYRNNTKQFLTTQQSHIYKNFLFFFLINFLEKYTNQKIWFRLTSVKTLNFFWTQFITNFLTKNAYTYNKFNRLVDTRELLNIIVLTAQTQDLNILLFFLKKTIEQAHFKKHKKILSIFFDILRKNKTIFSLNNVKGFSFDIRGKVGVSGNAKKRHLFFSLGKITTSSQNIKSQWQQISIWTPTGQMGVSCLLQS